MKIPIGKNPYVYPIPIALLGANVKGKPNYETVGDFGLMGINPALVCVSSHRDHYTNIGILENGTFSLNFPKTDMLVLVDYCGIASGHTTDKSALFESFYGELKTAPMIRECPVSLECRVLHEYSVQHRQMFIAEVHCAYADEKYLVEENGKKHIADLTTLDPILYALDNYYYSIGKPIGIGYQEGNTRRHHAL
jgi:flavin reductase (DIM6/NTAB) family NADH-FMN oxidoreductase RutF